MNQSVLFGGMSQSIFKIEPTPRFLRRVVDLNAFHNPADPLHDEILGGVDSEGPKDGVGSHTDGAWARKLLATIHHEFPEGAAAHEQAAYLVRAFGGLRPFAEANFRTGWDYTVGLLEHHGHPMLSEEADGRALGAELWERMQEAYGDKFSRQNVLDRDDLFSWLSEWFHHRIG